MLARTNISDGRKRLVDALWRDMDTIIPYMDDVNVTDVMVNSDGTVWSKSFAYGKRKESFTISSDIRFRIILNIAKLGGVELDCQNGLPILEGVLPTYFSDSHPDDPITPRVEAFLPPWVIEPAFTIRMPPRKIYDLGDYYDAKRISVKQLETVQDAIENKKNIIIAGGMGTGKTTFLNAIIKGSVDFHPEDRWYIVEDTGEVQCSAPDTTSLVVKPDHAVEAVRAYLRWSADRIIFGEIRYGTVADELFKAWNTGKSGNFATIHSNSAKMTIDRINGLLREVISGTIPDVSNVIDMIVFMKSHNETGPRVDSILSI